MVIALLFPLSASAFDPFNCYQWAAYRLDLVLPPMAQIVATATEQTPEKGMLAVFHYEKQGLYHVAVVEHVFDDGSYWISECNMKKMYGKPCGIRHLASDYANLIGFVVP